MYKVEISSQPTNFVASGREANQILKTFRQNNYAHVISQTATPVKLIFMDEEFHLEALRTVFFVEDIANLQESEQFLDDNSSTEDSINLDLVIDVEKSFTVGHISSNILQLLLSLRGNNYPTAYGGVVIVKIHQ